MLLWKGDHSSIRSANWFVPSSNSTNSVKEKQLNRNRHGGQGGEQHCPFCRQPDLDYIPVKFGYTCGSGRTGLSLWTEAIYVRLGARETTEPHGGSCYTNIDSHQWVTSLLPPLWLALFGNGLVQRRAVQSSQNTGCNYFLAFPLLQAATVQNTIHLILMEMVNARLIMINSWAPTHDCTLRDHPSHIYQVQEGFVPCGAPMCLVSSSKFSSWGTACFLHTGQSPAWTESSTSNAELQQKPTLQQTQTQPVLESE